MVDPLHLREVLKKYYADKQWRFSDYALSYDELEWFDQTPKPTPEEINQRYNEIVENVWREQHINIRKALYTPIEVLTEAMAEEIWKAQHVSIRRALYPSTEEMIVALWEKLVEEDGLTSPKIAEIQAARLAIKQQYPKLTKKPTTPYIEPKQEPDTFA